MQNSASFRIFGISSRLCSVSTGLGCFLALLFIAPPVWAVATCTGNETTNTLVLEPGQDEARCRYSLPIWNALKGIQGAHFIVSETGTYEREMVWRFAGIQHVNENLHIQEVPSHLKEAWEKAKSDAEKDLDSLFQVTLAPFEEFWLYPPGSPKLSHEFSPLIFGDQNERIVRDTYTVLAERGYNRREDFGVILLTNPLLLQTADWVGWEPLQIQVTLEVELVLRRVREGCWMTATVQGDVSGSEFGDYVFWSDNPTGLGDMRFDGEGDQPFGVLTAEEVQEKREVAAKLLEDREKLERLMGKELAAKMMSKDKIATSISGQGQKPKTDGGLAEVQAFSEGKTFLSLTSVKGDDDVSRVRGASAGIAGDLSMADLAIGSAHMLSQFNLQIIIGEEIVQKDIEEPDSFIDKQAPVERIAFAYKGNHFRWPSDQGGSAQLKLYRCQGKAADLGALCGEIVASLYSANAPRDGGPWPKVDLAAKFQAGPGAFSCINN